MPNLIARALSPFFVLRFALAILSGSALRAELVWTPSTGWTVEGGVLSGLIPEEGRNALASMNKARAEEQNGSHSSAMSRYESVAKKYPNSIFAPEALYRAARIRLERRQYFKAFDSFQNVVSRYPNSPHFNEIIGDQYRIANALVEGARNRYFGLIPGFKNRAKGITYFEKIVETAPYSDYAPLALMNIAQGHQKLDEPDEAIDALDRMINHYPQSLLAPDAYYKLAETHASLVQGPYYDQASTRQAITYFEDFLILFPGDSHVPAVDKGLIDVRNTFAESKIKIGDFYFYKRDNYKAARVFYNEAITSYPDSATAGVARERLADVEAAETKARTPDVPRPQPKHKSFWLF
ncbi:MAG: Tetratricopeptide 2 repeat protein [Rariglobus sp.]|jgi:outer membrane protein assembly factor BamD|nr:Tetratricopeptide 2 repeat protein [Rariglobus sp.]